MPAGDRTGPNGQGAKTGRGLGKAIGNDNGRTTDRPRLGRNRKEIPADNKLQSKKETLLDSILKLIDSWNKEK